MKPTKKSTVNTSFHSDTVFATINELTQILGEPSFSDNTGEDKVNFEWEMETSTGKVFTVYDWKEYLRLDPDDQISWHIGALSLSISREAAKEVTRALSKIKSTP